MRLAVATRLLLLLVGSTAAHRQTYSGSLQCRVDDPLSCSQAKGEVCVFVNGQYKCECPTGVQRLGDGRCKLINECAEPRLNGCHRDAMCQDMIDGYTCQCKPGFADISEDREEKPGRICQRTQNECRNKQTYGVDCDANAACVDRPEGFMCVCQPGYVDVSAQYSLNPGRKCVPVVNECTSGAADCSANAECIDRADGYECRCRKGYVDASPDTAHYPGRVCNQPHAPEYYGKHAPEPSQCSDNTNCGPNEQCRPNPEGVYKCECQRGAVRGQDGSCKAFNRCETANECSRNALCSNTYDGCKCQCKSGFLDVSPDPLRLPGRKCEPLVNECAEGTHDCHPLATCEDRQTGYVCKCNADTTDVSSRYGLKPGRKCSEVNNQCSDKSLNTCDENADCVQLPDGYTCKCGAGFVDVSSNANLPPGRACSLHTACPAQPTDLVFLIDGSGSIGSYIFQTEVLRFLSEFTELFDISPAKTRVSVVQYSDQIRHEFNLGEYADSKSLHDGIQSIEYLTGLTRTGAAIEHVATEAFSEARGARPPSDQISRVAIVITDGRSQDNVTIPATNARRAGIQLFAVGVTAHVLDSELEEISGSKDRTFHVNGFEDLNTRLRSAIQKVACPQAEQPEPSKGPCDPSTHNGCDRALNQVCQVDKDGKFACGCPKGFELHPVTKVCGGDACNPEIASACPYPEVCEKTPFGNYRCSCAEGWRDKITGVCKTVPPIADSTDECKLGDDSNCGPGGKCIKGPGGEAVCQCGEGYERDPLTDKCRESGTCDPTKAGCDPNKNEKCLDDGKGHFTCQCANGGRRHPVTSICLDNECVAGTHDCSPHAKCTDTDESYLCACNAGFLDKSPDQAKKPGRVCSQERNECLDGTHNCSMNALCIDLPDGFLCRCKDDFVDASPNPAHFAGTDCRPLVNECAGKEANTCHEHAICIDTRDSYKCQCKEGFVDQDELRNPGRNCQKLNQVCEKGQHDCAPNARCIERGAKDYECVCPAGFLDNSKDPAKPGRSCLERVCLDPSKHDCHAAAVCTEVDGPEKYTCQCRDGYVDENKFNPGRQCKELINECLDSSLNDCDPIATCKDEADGYTCVCPIGSRDKSPDADKPGRHCFALVNECLNPHLNNCSRFADCEDLEEGYSCKCKSEYHDETPETPGVNCKFMLNECAAENLNDCSKHAECIDTPEGFECRCKDPFVDTMPMKAGRVCKYNECEDPSRNDCDANADCIDTEDGYTCQCKTGYFDEAPDSEKPGRACIALHIDQPPQEAPPTTPNPNLIPCGGLNCRKDLREVCIGGACCDCRPGESRKSPDDVCAPVEEIPIVVRVVDDGGKPLSYSSEYGSKKSPKVVSITDAFTKGLGEAFHRSALSPKYVSSDVNFITNPKVENSTWDKGLLINGTVKMDGPVDKCELFREFAKAVKEQGGQLTSLKVADDFEQLDPCKPPPQMGEPCGAGFCDSSLGEECVAGKLCACPEGMKRTKEGDMCRAVESWNLPLYVVKDGNKKITYSPEMSNPMNDIHKDLVSRFESGVSESYDKTPLKGSFITAEVNDIEKPADRNMSWTSGALFNFTSYFVKGSVSEPRKVFTDLVEYIIKKNNKEVGTSKLFISADQANPFSVCYNANCGDNAVCKEDGHGGYTCSCPAGFRDLDASSPGQKCLSLRGTNECERPEWNDCSPDARCIDLEVLYKCECVAPYVNAAPAGKLPGSVCEIDYCSDVNFCPRNTTCKNVGEQAQCDCDRGFVDIRHSERLSEAGLSETACLRSTDVDECALGLHNCSAAAVCTDRKDGYDCRCPEGYTDGNPSEPGRVCAALLCGLCNGHGDCIHDALTSNVTCACADGWTGEFCDVAPSNAGLILMTLLALLFLLLTLLCCLYACARCRCFGARGKSAGSASGAEILGSDYYTIPRAKLKNGAYGDELAVRDNADALGAYLDGASLSSDGSIEEIERRVTTDVTTREIRTTTVHDEEGNVLSQSQTIINGASDGGLETEVDRFAMTSSDHFASNVIGSSSAAAAGGAHMMHRSASNAGYDSDGDSDAGNATYDRVSRFNTRHDFEPSEHGAVERRVNEAVTTTTSNEVNYF